MLLFDSKNPAFSVYQMKRLEMRFMKWNVVWGFRV